MFYGLASANESSILLFQVSVRKEVHNEKDHPETLDGTVGAGHRGIRSDAGGHTGSRGWHRTINRLECEHRILKCG